MDLDTAIRIKDELSGKLLLGIPSNVFDTISVVEKSIDGSWKDGEAAKKRAYQEQIVGTAIRLMPPFIHAIDVAADVDSDGVIVPTAITVHLNRIPTDCEANPFPVTSVAGLPIVQVPSPLAVVAASLPPSSKSRANAIDGTCTSGRRNRIRPMIGGISVGNSKGDTGTLGYFCRSTDPADSDDSVYILSNRHILARPAGFVSGDIVIQPGILDYGTDHDEVAILTRAPHVAPGLGPYQVDAAIAMLKDRTNYLDVICSIGRVGGTCPARPKMRVKLHGRESGAVCGYVESISSNNLVLLDQAQPLSTARFTGQIRIKSHVFAEAFGQSGDSGSLLVTDTSEEQGINAVGLFFAAAIPYVGTLAAGLAQYGLANPIGKVLSELKIELV